MMKSDIKYAYIKIHLVLKVAVL